MSIEIFFGLLMLLLALLFLLVPIRGLRWVKRRIDDPLTSAGARRGYIHYRTALFALLAPILSWFGNFFIGLAGDSLNEILATIAFWSIYLIPAALGVSLVFYVLGRVELSKASND